MPSTTSLSVYPLRFSFIARDAVHFPEGQASNILRGAFGTIFRRLACDPQCPGAKQCDRRVSCAYARVFEPGATTDASTGYGDWPRPFVFRSTHLEGQTIRAGEPFHFGLNLFDTHVPAALFFALSFAEISRDGLGPSRGRADLVDVSQLDESGAPVACVFDGAAPGPTTLPLLISLDPIEERVERIVVRFVTPTELKDAGALAARPEFGILLPRLRDRISALNKLYGDGPLAADSRAFAARADAVEMTRCEVSHVGRWRRSSRTGAVHPLGGFVGEAEYCGDLTEFLPYLRAGRWTGVGRQTAWGKGELAALERCQNRPR
jgi:hypothetical protein